MRTEENLRAMLKDHEETNCQCAICKHSAKLLKWVLNDGE